MPNGEAVVEVGKTESGGKVGKAVEEWKVERGGFRVFEEEVGPIGRNLGDTSSRKSHYLRHALAFSIWTDPPVQRMNQRQSLSVNHSVPLLFPTRKSSTKIHETAPFSEVVPQQSAPLPKIKSQKQTTILHACWDGIGCREQNLSFRIVVKMDWFSKETQWMETAE